MRPSAQGLRSWRMPERGYAAQLSPSCVLLAEEVKGPNGAAGAALQSGDGAGAQASQVLGDIRLAIQTPDGQAEFDDIGTLVRRVLAPLDAPGRAEALGFLAKTLDLVPAG